jgi:uncharacterized protein (DUF58 family)
MMALKRRLQQLSQQWLARRIPASPSQRLHHRTLFIFPSPFGLGYLLMVLGLFVMGTNYQNNLMLLLSYFLLSLFLLSLFYCFFSLAGLQVDATAPPRAAAGSALAVHLTIAPHQRQPSQPRVCGNAQLTWSTEQQASTAMMLPKGESVLPFQLPRRGPVRLPRIKIQTVYPFGLFRCWSHLDFAFYTMVDPTPIPCPVTPVPIDEGDEYDTTASTYAAADGDDADGVRQYQPGDALQRVAWKQVAKGGDWQTKKFSGEAHRSGWLVFTHGADREAELGRLSYQVLALAHAKQVFGLQLPHIHSPLGEGDKHVGDCLDALATAPLGRFA